MSTLRTEKRVGRGPGGEIRVISPTGAALKMTVVPFSSFTKEAISRNLDPKKSVFSGTRRSRTESKQD
jgi:hypothetical protein